MLFMIHDENAHLFISAPNWLHWNVTSKNVFFFTHKTLIITVLDIHFEGSVIFDRKHTKCNKVKLFVKKEFIHFTIIFCMHSYRLMKDVMDPREFEIKENIFD